MNIASLEPSELASAPSSGVPFRRDCDFIDRGNLLDQIEKKCAEKVPRVALVGIGGVGKSQLAIEYCHRLRDQSPSTWIFWVYASNAERIEQSYREIAEQVNIEERAEPSNNIFELVAKWLRDETNGKWLLVLDNLDDDSLLLLPDTVVSNEEGGGKTSRLQRSLSTYIPQNSNGALLVTSRNRSVAQKLAEPHDIIVVEPMAEIDAVALLQKKLDNTNPETDLKELTSALEYMPLALVQAAAFIRQKGSSYSVRQYIDEFQKSDEQKTSLLNYEAGHLRRDPEAKNSIIITWQISFSHIREQWPSTAELLALMSCFDRQGIPEEALTVDIATMLQGGSGANDETDKVTNEHTWQESDPEVSAEQFQEDIDRLRNYSFVSVGSSKQTFQMHRLVQLATQKWLEMNKEDEMWRNEFCRRIDAVFPAPEFANWSQCERLMPHVKIAERNQPAADEFILRWGGLLGKAGTYFIQTGIHNEGEAMLYKSVQVLRQKLGDDDPGMMTLMNNLVVAYNSQGKYSEAEELVVKVAETRRKELGDEHPDTLISMGNLAIMLQAQGRLTEAEELETKLLKTWRKIQGDEDIFTLQTMSNLAWTYGRQGRLTEAEEMQVTVLKTRQRLLGEEHPSTLHSMDNLAALIKMQGREAEAMELMSNCVRLKEQVLGIEHPIYVDALKRLTEWQGKEE